MRERCGLFWGVTGRTMLRDEAHAFLQAGAAIEAADMVLRMLRVALPTDGVDEEAHARDGQALALLQAVGGFQAYRRAVPAPPNAAARRPLPALRARLPGLGRLLGRGAARGADRRRPELPRLARRAAAEPADGRPRLPRARDRRDGAFAGTLGVVQRELRQVDADIAHRYFGGAGTPAARLVTALMHFAIRYLTEYRTTRR